VLRCTYTLSPVTLSRSLCPPVTLSPVILSPVTSSPGHFVPWSLSPRSLCPRSLCSLVILPLRSLCPQSLCPPVTLSPGHFVPLSFCPPVTLSPSHVSHLLFLVNLRKFGISNKNATKLIFFYLCYLQNRNETRNAYNRDILLVLALRAF
jgi:hypothetical protein